MKKYSADADDEHKMSSRKGKQDLKAGMERLESMVDSIVEKHLGGFPETQP